MRRPHVYQRSAPRQQASGHGRADDRAAALRMLSAQLAAMTDKADAVGAESLADLLDDARFEAERLLAEAGHADPGAA